MLRKIVKTRAKTISGGDVVEIKSDTVYNGMPLVIPFAASYGTYEKRESIVIELEDTDGYIGFGEVVAFSEPWYTEETVKTALHVLQDFCYLIY